MDSFELNKIIGAILGTCILLLVTSFAAGAIFSPGCRKSRASRSP